MNTHGKISTSSTVTVINCNHGGFYSVNDGSTMLGQIQKITPRKWAARRHGNYRDEKPPTFGTRGGAVAFLVGAA